MFNKLFVEMKRVKVDLPSFHATLSRRLLSHIETWQDHGIGRSSVWSGDQKIASNYSLNQKIMEIRFIDNDPLKQLITLFPFLVGEDGKYRLHLLRVFGARTC